MHKVVVTSDVVTIYQSAGIIRIVPRQFLPDEESWQVFRRLAGAATSSANPSPRPMRVFLVWIAIVIVVFLLWELYQRT